MATSEEYRTELDRIIAGVSAANEKVKEKGGTPTTPYTLAGLEAAIDSIPEASEPVLQEKTVTPSASAQTVAPDNGYDGLSQVVVEGDTDLKADNITEGVNIFGVAGANPYAKAATDAEVSDQSDLLDQAIAALEGKAGGGSGGVTLEACALTSTKLSSGAQNITYLNTNGECIQTTFNTANGVSDIAKGSICYIAPITPSSSYGYSATSGALYTDYQRLVLHMSADVSISYER